MRQICSLGLTSHSYLPLWLGGVALTNNHQSLAPGGLERKGLALDMGSLR